MSALYVLLFLFLACLGGWGLDQAINRSAYRRREQYLANRYRNRRTS